MNMKEMPRIQKYMTTMPHTINSELPLKTAIERMNEYNIRHLPVLSGGKLVGVLTDRDIKLATSFNHAEELLVDDVMTTEPYTITPNALLNEVVFEMAEKRYGCAVIQQENGKTVGIFTATDGLRVLGELLQLYFKPAADSGAWKTM